MSEPLPKGYLETPVIFGNKTSRQVWIDGKELTPERSQAVRQHSTADPFGWGYAGSAPQLALANSPPTDNHKSDRPPQPTAPATT